MLKAFSIDLICHYSSNAFPVIHDLLPKRSSQPNIVHNLRRLLKTPSSFIRSNKLFYPYVDEIGDEDCSGNACEIWLNTVDIAKNLLCSSYSEKLLYEADKWLDTKKSY